MKVIALFIVLSCISAYGQDSAIMAAQQAQQAAQQAQQQAIDFAQQAQQDAIRANQQAMRNAQQATDDAMRNAQQNSGPVIGITRQPTFSVNSGPIAPGDTVRIKCATHYAVIYYTTNGFTPTIASPRYTGPVAINASMQLRAVAVAPNMSRSPVAHADYTVQGPPAAMYPLALSSHGVLHAGTMLRLVTDSEANSKTAQVGDKLRLLLDQDITASDVVIVHRGATAEATITQADPAGHAGNPGDLAFEVQSLTVHGTPVPVRGGETLEGANRYTRSKALIVVPVIGVPGLLLRGDEAVIKPGMTFTATVTADTPLQP